MLHIGNRCIVLIEKMVELKNGNERSDTVFDLRGSTDKLNLFYEHGRHHKGEYTNTIK